MGLHYTHTRRTVWRATQPKGGNMAKGTKRQQHIRRTVKAKRAAYYKRLNAWLARCATLGVPLPTANPRTWFKQ